MINSHKKNIPLPPVFSPGKPVTVSEWENTRRPEILGLFSDYVYGQTPAELPDVSYKLEPVDCRCAGVDATVLTLTMRRNGKTCAFRSDIYRPKNLKGRLPAVVMIDPFSAKFFRGKNSVYQYCPPDMITGAGFVAARARVDEACPDKPGGRGLTELYPQGGETAWGAIGAWAFLTSRLIDYLWTCGGIDPARVAVCGHSRAGKTALWCGAQDARVGAAISNNSGCSGAAVTRGKAGERIADITKRFPYWFCPRYAQFAGREDELPVDQHMLLSLIAPRKLYVASASKDKWADPQAEFWAASLCGEAYALYGKTGLSVADLPAWPAPRNPLHDGSVGYHLRNGRHAVTRCDWEQFLAFLSRASGIGEEP